MAITNPVEIPSTGELGKTFFPRLEIWGARINSHKHDGIDSEQIKLKDLIRDGSDGVNIHLDETIGITGAGYHDFDLTSYTNIDAQSAQLQLRDADSDYEVVDEIKITAPDADTVRVTTSMSFAGNFRLIVRGE